MKMRLMLGLIIALFGINALFAEIQIIDENVNTSIYLELQDGGFVFSRGSVTFDPTSVRGDALIVLARGFLFGGQHVSRKFKFRVSALEDGGVYDLSIERQHDVFQGEHGVVAVIERDFCVLIAQDGARIDCESEWDPREEGHNML